MPTRRLWIAGLLIVGAIGFLVYKGLGNSLVYFRTVNQAVAMRSQLGTTSFRLEGKVVPGTVKAVPGGVRFEVSAGGDTVAVVDHGQPPQMFAPGIPVVLEGHFVSVTGDFVSNQILVKHSSSYIAAHPGRVKGDPTAA